MDPFTRKEWYDIKVRWAAPGGGAVRAEPARRAPRHPLAARPRARLAPAPPQAPSMFTHRIAGKTPVTRTGGTHVASESLKGRVFTVRCVRRPAARPQAATSGACCRCHPPPSAPSYPRIPLSSRRPPLSFCASSLADLQGSEDMDYRKIKLVGEEVQGKVRPRAVSCAVVVVLSFGRPRATPRSAPPLPPRSCC